MPRQRLKGQKPIESFDIYHGYDQDVNTWFVEIQVPKFGSGQILEWFKTEEAYEKRIKELRYIVQFLLKMLSSLQSMIIKESAVVMISGSFCSNCGHDSHCGTRYVADIDRSGNEIEVCKYCRCEKCQDRD